MRPARDQLASYLKMLQKRLRLGALLRGAAALVAVALTATARPGADHECLRLFRFEPLRGRVALVLALAAVVGYGLALPWRALNDRRAARKAEAAFPQFDQRLVTFAERDRGGRDPFLELLAADTLQVAQSAEPASLGSEWQASGLDCQRRSIPRRTRVDDRRGARVSLAMARRGCGPARCTHRSLL